MSAAPDTGFQVTFDLSIYREEAVRQAADALSSVAPLDIEVVASRVLVRAQDRLILAWFEDSGENS